MSARKNIDWHAVPADVWANNTNQALADQWGCSPTLVAKYRKILQAPATPAFVAATVVDGAPPAPPSWINGKQNSAYEAWHRKWTIAGRLQAEKVKNAKRMRSTPFKGSRLKYIQCVECGCVELRRMIVVQWRRVPGLSAKLHGVCPECQKKDDDA